jgi:CRP-like cAMP-binding protein
MQNQLEDFIYKRVKNPSVHEVGEILSIFKEKTYAKGTFFKERDSVIKVLGFLVEGSARSYFINEKGDEITDEILQNNNFLSDIISVRTNKKSPMIVEFLEKSIVSVAKMDDVWDLLDRSVVFNILIREYIGDRSMELLKRHLMFLNGTAKERYQYLLATNPSLQQKFPLRYIASMIGVTQTQLSRIRNEKT